MFWHFYFWPFCHWKLVGSIFSFMQLKPYLHMYNWNWAWQYSAKACSFVHYNSKAIIFSFTLCFMMQHSILKINWTQPFSCLSAEAIFQMWFLLWQIYLTEKVILIHTFPEGFDLLINTCKEGFNPVYKNEKKSNDFYFRRKYHFHVFLLKEFFRCNDM